MDIGKLGSGIVVIVLGALMLVDGLLTGAGGTAIFFGSTNSAFVAVVGIVALLLGGSLLAEGRK
jgi:hypothetical protein